MLFNHLVGLAYDLEPMAPAARHRKAEVACSAPTNAGGQAAEVGFLTSTD
ncbi:hypothetical protein [Bacillus marasmi]|nr:hypothetical protein [Bacillus marasmi]